MKIAIIGGSSQSTPWLFRAPEIQRNLHRMEFTLCGRDARKLRAVANAIELLAQPHAVQLTIATGDFEEALCDADTVVLQARYGGYEGRSHDERFPLDYGIPGDEGLGPGGLSSAWRSWPPLCETLASIARVTPRATIVLLSSPLGVLTRCATTQFPELRLFGLCELPWSTLRALCSSAKLDVAGAVFSYAGINHLGWFDEVTAGERDLVPEATVLRELAARVHAVPLKYQRLVYEREAVVEEQRRSASRAQCLRDLADSAIEAFESGDERAMRAALAERPAPWYGDALAPLLASLIDGDAGPTAFFLTTRNDGYLPSLDDDDIVERPFHYRGGALRALWRTRSLAPVLREAVEPLVHYERIAAQAVISRDSKALTGALAAHPWVNSAETARALASHIG